MQEFSSSTVGANASQAGANYDNLSESIADTLEMIDEQLTYWGERIEKHGNLKMREYQIGIYVVQTEMLCEIFDRWSKSKGARLLASFNQEAVDDIVGKSKSELKNLEKKLKAEEGDIKFEAGIRETQGVGQQVEGVGHRVEGVEQKVQVLGHMSATFANALNAGLKDTQKLIQDNQKAQSIQIGYSIQTLLEEFNLLKATVNAQLLPVGNALPMLDGPRGFVEGSASQVTTRAPSPVLQPQYTEPEPMEQTMREAIFSLGEVVNQHLNDLSRFIGRVRSLKVDSEVQRRIEAFLQATGDQALWIQGPGDVSLPSQNTMTAALLASIISQNKGICIQYYNSVTTMQGRNRDHRLALGVLITSLTVQILLALSPDEMKTIKHLAPQIADLGSGELSYNEALELLITLRKALSKDTFIVIDYCQVLEQQRDQEYTATLQTLLNTLLTLQSGDGSDRRAADGLAQASVPTTKICLLTDGYMNLLGQVRRKRQLDHVEYDMDSDELNVDATERMSL
jgi:hypothetical protein